MSMVYNGVEFNVGDRVKVLRAFGVGEMNGMGSLGEWDNEWVGEMDHCIGNEYAIVAAYDVVGVELDTSGDEHLVGTGYGFPLSVLQKV